MAKNVSMVRQITSVAQQWIGYTAQLIVDTGLNVIRVHDGQTRGGFIALGAQNNLSELASAPTTRNNLGLGSAATHAATDFDNAGAAAAALVSAEAYTDLETAARITAVTNEANTRIAGDAAVVASSNQRASNLSDVANAATARTNLGVYSKTEVDGQSFKLQPGVTIPNDGAFHDLCNQGGNGGGVCMIGGDDGLGHTISGFIPFYQFQGNVQGLISLDSGGTWGVISFTAGGGTGKLRMAITGGVVGSITLAVRFASL